jgi:hypothetical protein
VIFHPSKLFLQGLTSAQPAVHFLRTSLLFQLLLPTRIAWLMQERDECGLSSTIRTFSESRRISWNGRCQTGISPSATASHVAQSQNWRMGDGMPRCGRKQLLRMGQHALPVLTGTALSSSEDLLFGCRFKRQLYISNFSWLHDLVTHAASWPDSECCDAAEECATWT